MTIERLRGTSFTQKTYEAWKVEAEKALKGKPFETLVTETLEGIKLQPLYTKEMVENRDKISAAVRKQKNTGSWTIAQDVFTDTAEQYLLSLKDSLSKGNETIVYKSYGFEWSENQLHELAQLMTEYPIHFYIYDQHDPIIQVFDMIGQKDSVKGFISDPKYLTAFTNLKLIVDTTEIHYMGANTVQELAVALYMVTKSDKYLNRIAVRFQVDTNFFMEMAKLRAFRVLWKALIEAYDTESVPVGLIAETSLRSFSKLDPDVNLLRTGNMAFSAALGGAELITVHPHTILTGTTEKSVRLARNVQLIIREEAHIGKVVDPAGGSYYIESLTAQLAELAWTQFLNIQENGLDQLYAEVESVRKKKEDLLAVRKVSLIGTNKYADPSNEVNTTIAIPVKRLAETYEHLRADGQPPKTALLLFGPLKDVKPRADFVSGFLNVGGISPVWSPSFNDPVESLKWLRDEKIEYAVVCAKDDECPNIVGSLLKLKPESIIDIAGRFDQKVMDAWKKEGLNGCIYNGQHIVEKLASILSLRKEAENR
ncbi:methylmalonyl-CoA mutase family protein [Chungangia koreensis]|uniref:Methylmalonyl-CoA mutase family protein n=1 Tax=Chungangia koreensis TaxID=752657 RepID=A0ABV8X897_9LACT